MIFLGYRTTTNTVERTIFTSAANPTFATHGTQYNAVVGPFRTRRGARFMRDYGQGNPHCRCVRDAERLGKMHAYPLDTHRS